MRAMDFLASDHLGAVGRRIIPAERDGRAVSRLTATRTFPAPAAEVWDALTDPGRIARWLMPVTGDLRLGGRYQLEGNAGGEVLACDEPRHLALTWEYDGHVSWVDVELTDVGAGTLLTLDHDDPSTPEHGARFGPGAVGIGWELSLLGLGAQLVGEPDLSPDEKTALMADPEMLVLITGSNAAWVDAAILGGEDPGQAHAAGRRCLAAYAGAPEA